MSTSQTIDRLAEMLVGPLGGLGLDLEDVDLSSAGKRRVLRVAVDSDNGVGMEDIAEATRMVSATLDGSDVMGERPYTLEVSSPGVDRPLRLPRNWRRNIGRLVKVTVADGEVVTGRIVAAGAAEDGAAVLDVDGAERQVAYPQVKRALVQIEFGKPAARPQD